MTRRPDPSFVVMGILAEPACRKRHCRHFDGIRSDGDELSERLVCPAFPEGIPFAIQTGEDLHATLHPEQLGDLVFERSTR